MVSADARSGRLMSVLRVLMVAGGSSLHFLGSQMPLLGALAVVSVCGCGAVGEVGQTEDQKQRQR